MILRRALICGGLGQTPSQGCTEELGPRWLLVTSTGGDLTGVVVDGYGCGDVRLTNDPYVTAPGDPQTGATVPGVLDAPGLAATLGHDRPR